MAIYNDFNKDDETDNSYGSGSSNSSGSTAESNYSEPPKQTDNKPSWDQLLNANKDAAAAYGANLEKNSQTQVNAVNQAAGAGQKIFNTGVSSNFIPGGKTPGLNSDGTVTSAPTSPVYDTVTGPPGPTQTAPTSSDVQSAPSGPGSADPVDASATTWDQILKPTPPPNPSPGPAHHAPPQGPSNTPIAQVSPIARVAAPTTLSNAAIQNGPSGPQDLSQALGDTGWTQLLGDANKADQTVSALGSQNGLQALISQNGQLGGTAEDAALIGASSPNLYKYSQNPTNQLQNIENLNANDSSQWSKLFQEASDAKTNLPTPGPAPVYDHTDPDDVVERQAPLTTGQPQANSETPGRYGLDTSKAPPPQGGFDKFLGAFGGSGTSYDVSGPPNFSAVLPSQEGGGAGGTLPDGQVWFPLTGLSSNGGTVPPSYNGYGSTIAWGDFWGDASGAPTNGASWNPGSLGLTGAEWYTIGNMSPADRAKWWTDYGQALADASDKSGQDNHSGSDLINYPPNPLG